MSTPRQPRYAFAPLAAVARCDSDVALGRALGVHPRQFTRWREQGMKVWVADRAAVRLGLHPALVWGMEWWDSAEAS